MSILEELGGRRGRIPVVLLTGYTNQDIQQLGHRAGALNFLSKDDVSANTLDAVIRSTLHTHELESKLFTTLTERDRALRTKLDTFGQLSGQIDKPLRSIAEIAARISDRAIADRMDECFVTDIQVIQNNVKQVHDLVDDLIRQVHADQYLPEMTFESVDIGELIGTALRLIDAQIADRAQSVDFQMPHNPVVARIDRTAMLQALLNVLSNAGKFSARNTTITLRAFEQDGHAVVSILDQGTGMSRTEIETALEPFGRGPLPLEFVQKGTGLGLPIASSILERHGGRMELNSAPGRVTEIKLIFPIVR